MGVPGRPGEGGALDGNERVLRAAPWRPLPNRRRRGPHGRGEFVELDPPRRLVFTFGWEPEPGAEGPNPVPPGSSTVEIELAPDGDGTRLRFTHRDLPNAEAVESHGHGWDHYLQRLAVAAGGGDPGSDPWLSGEM